MLQNWQLLLAEIGGLLLVDTLLGVAVGWIIWGRR